MSQLYNRIAERYFEYQREKSKLIQEQEILSAKIKTLEGVMLDLMDELSKRGTHIYEHFEEGVGE